MPIKLKTEKVGEKEYAVIQDGKPVYIHDDGKEIPFDAEHTSTTISRLNGEAKAHREAKEKFEKDLQKFAGIEDPAAALKALETVKNLDEGKLLTATRVEEIKLAAKKTAEEQVAAAVASANAKLKELETDRDTLNNQLYHERVGGAFSRSKYIADKIAIPADIMRAQFGSSFKIEEGKIVAYGAEGNKVYSRVKNGEVADFEEAIEILVDSYPNKEHILRGTGGGTGARGGAGGGGGGPKTLTRQQFDSLDHLERAAKMRDGFKVVDAA